MSIRPSIIRNARRVLRNYPCVFCLYRNPQPVRHYAAPYRVDPTKSPHEIRAEIDQRNRNAYYRMLQADKLLPVKLDDANRIIHQFIVNKKNINPADNARQLAAQFKLDVVHLAYLAIPLFRIPDVTDSKAQLPPSQNRMVGATMLLACSAAKDLTSTLQILNAVYYNSNGYDIPQAAEIARLFTQNEINKCKKILEELAEGGEASAMTLHGRFLELSGKKQEAWYFYEKALGKYDTTIHPNYPHPMALPWLTPWTALSNLQPNDRSPGSIASIKKALEFGALKADDPMAYYQLACLEETKSSNWLAYMSKAAASGHSEAMYKLGKFYVHVNAEPSAFLKDGKFRAALKFMTSWKKKCTADFAMEWFKAAALGGHKPSMLEMARLYGDDTENVKTWLRAVLSDPPKGKEQWPQLVMEARKRLASM